MSNKTVISEDRSETVFVVEDEEPIRFLIETVLNRAGFKVITAGDGEEAARRLAAMNAKIDLLVTDLALPGLSGDDLAVDARRMYPDLKVIFASGSFGQSPVENVTRIPDAIFLLKPFSAVQLMFAVRRALCLPGEER